ncbi:regulator of telomere elongation helicase 1 homolog [Anastrepha ludens]|uniref:regulator of telomere elongation helicase 1 homolog n=1 Tax=Anastrepha ludens TaxID=28586 RepID=UPI0023AF5129|nr:regulator of telomere elongation helicase 1 homolog [Anastrepha ludens]XP_053949812.1 regulator of telomere elongation helicase 1 homolog [Anastrepha ludens]
MPEYIIAGIPVHFPFEPYDVQTAYMEKVINCLRDGTNGVLESPTGTGKTLSLLCASLAWLLSRRADLQSMLQRNVAGGATSQQGVPELNAIQGRNANWGIPKIIYSSRTHSQLTQAMQELKRTSYSFMRAVVLGSRDQLCIHPEVMREQGNSNKVQLCKLRIQTRTCSFYNRVESKKDSPELKESPIMDIEDLVKVGQKLKVCPYYASKELTSEADITFMPYNYLLDPKARKANKVELGNTIVILDEAHNIEKICEESASVQIRSSDIALAIDDVTHVMKAMMNENSLDFMSGDEPKDFKLEDLALLKEMLLDLEKAFDNIVVENKAEGTTFPPSYMFELLAAAKITPAIAPATISLLERLIQYMTVQSQNSAFRKGASFETFSNLLSVVFVKKDDIVEKVHRSFKVHVQIEEVKQQNKGSNKDGWLSKASSNSTVSTKLPKIINYWCFNPGFGMEQLLNAQTRSIILTSGTLAPLKPLIAELAVPIAQSLENPHIVNQSQVFVKIIGTGPDREQLISNFANRDNPKYLSSLGQTILNVSRIVPDGLLVFFPSYPLLNQCVNAWQASGVWAEVCRHKPIFVEPRSKESFTTTMEEFYKSIHDTKGACFMAVCRGKVSEGLDFADRNGRAVIITGLPFPPMKDPKVILKKRYLEDNRTKENELLTGQAWYSLEATRAVNQAIGRVIRHRHDYGAILLCDVRFAQPNQVSQLSKWVRGHLGATPKSVPFGSIVRELREFFRNADKTLPKPKERSIEALVSETCEEAGIVHSRYFSDPKLVLEAKQKFATAHSMAIKVEKTNTIESWTPDDYKTAAGRSQNSQIPSAMDFMSRLDTNVKAIDFNSASSSAQVSIYKRERNSPIASPSSSGQSSSVLPTNSKKKRYKLITDTSVPESPTSSTQFALNEFGFKSKTKLSHDAPVIEKEAPQERVEFLRILRSSLPPDDFSAFTAGLMAYSRQDEFEEFLKILVRIMGKPELHYMLRGMRRFIKSSHKLLFDEGTAHILS